MALEAKPVLVVYRVGNTIRAFHAETYSCQPCQRTVVIMEQEGFDITDEVIGIAIRDGARIIEMSKP
jgi:hypothetical protein